MDRPGVRQVPEGSGEQGKMEKTGCKIIRKILHILYKNQITNEEVRGKIQQAIGPHEDLLTIVKRRKLLPVHQVWPKPFCETQ